MAKNTELDYFTGYLMAQYNQAQGKGGLGDVGQHGFHQEECKARGGHDKSDNIEGGTHSMEKCQHIMSNLDNLDLDKGKN